MPDPQRPVLAPRHDDWQLRVEENRGYVLCVAFQRLDARFRLIVPDADRLGSSNVETEYLVVRAGEEIRLVSRGGVAEPVHTGFVLVERVVGRARVEAPDLDRVVEGAGSERVAVFRVELHLHDIMGMTLVCLAVSEINTGAGTRMLRQFCSQFHSLIIMSSPPERIRGSVGWTSMQRM